MVSLTIMTMSQMLTKDTVPLTPNSERMRNIYTRPFNVVDSQKGF